MPSTSIWVHLIWATKNRSPILTKELREILFQHIRENALLKEIQLDTIGGVADHVHLLIRLWPDQTVARIAQLIKGESSHWVNSQNITPFKFEWQDEYMAVSVSHSQLHRVREYIRTQEEHHRKRSLAEEEQSTLVEAGIEGVKTPQ